MAVAIPILAGLGGAAGGAALGAGLAASVGLTGMWAGVAMGAAAGLGGAITSAAASGNLDELFDDPTALFTSAALGGLTGGATHAFSGATQAVGPEVALEGAPEIAEGISSQAAQQAGGYSVIESGAMEVANGNTMFNESLGDLVGTTVKAGKDNFTNPDYLQAIQEAPTSVAKNEMAEAVMKVQDFQDLFKASDLMVDVPDTSVVDPFSVNEAFGLPGKSALDESTYRLSAKPTYDLAPSTDKYGVGSNIDATAGFEDFQADMEAEPGYGDKAKDALKEALKGMGGMPEFGGSYNLPQSPVLPINQITGSQGMGAGSAGLIGDDELHNNPVVRPMRDALLRQQSRAERVANNAWGLLSSTRQQGLMT